MACGREGSGMVPKMMERPLWEGVWPSLDPWDSVAQPPRIGTLQGSMGPMASSSSFSMKEPTVLSELVEFGPCISAEAVKACTLIGLHMMAEECPSVGQ